MQGQGQAQAQAHHAAQEAKRQRTAYNANSAAPHSQVHNFPEGPHCCTEVGTWIVQKGLKRVPLYLALLSSARVYILQRDHWGIPQPISAALMQEYAQHGSYAAPASYGQPPAMAAPAYGGQLGAYAGPIYPQQAAYGEPSVLCNFSICLHDAFSLDIKFRYLSLFTRAAQVLTGALRMAQVSTPGRWRAGHLRTARGRAPRMRSRLPGRRRQGPGRATVSATLRFLGALGPHLALCRGMVQRARGCPWRLPDMARALLLPAMASRHLKSRHGSGRDGSAGMSQNREVSGLMIMTRVDEHRKHMM